MAALSLDFYLDCFMQTDGKLVARQQVNNQFIQTYVRRIQEACGIKEALEEALSKLKQYEKRLDDILNDMSYFALVSAQIWQEEKITFRYESDWWKALAENNDNFKRDLFVKLWQQQRQANISKSKSMVYL